MQSFKKGKGQILCLILAVCMLVTFCPAKTYAAATVTATDVTASKDKSGLYQVSVKNTEGIIRCADSDDSWAAWLTLDGTALSDTIKPSMGYCEELVWTGIDLSGAAAGTHTLAVIVKDEDTAKETEVGKTSVTISSAASGSNAASGNSAAVSDNDTGKDSGTESTAKLSLFYDSRTSGLCMTLSGADFKKVKYQISSESGKVLYTTAAKTVTDGGQVTELSMKTLIKKNGNVIPQSLKVEAIYANKCRCTATYVVYSGGTLTATPTSTQKKVTIFLKKAAGDFSKVEFKVYHKGSESKAVAVEAVKSGSTYKYALDVSKVSSQGTGTYLVNAYGTTSLGTMMLGSGSFKLSAGTATISVEKKASEGKMIVTVSDIEIKGTVAKIEIAASANGITKTYTAEKQSSGSYTATVPADDFSYFKGKYRLVAYVTHKTSGIYGKIAAKNVTFKPTGKNGWYYETYNGKKYKFYYENGKKVTDLTKVLNLKESSGTTLNSKYYIEVNRMANVVTVYYYDDATNSYCIPVIAFTVSCGADYWTNAGASGLGLSTSYTPIGEFTISARGNGETAKLSLKVFNEINKSTGATYNLYGKYASHITNAVYFHSIAVSDTKGNVMNPYTYNKLGSHASEGCIRMQVADAKWIYDYVSVGTKVKIIYGSSSTPGPFGKPTNPKINTSNPVYYDPTNPAISDAQKAKDYAAGKITGYMKADRTKVGY